MSAKSATQSKDWRSSRRLRKRARFLLDHPDLEIPTDVEFEIGFHQGKPEKTFKTYKIFLSLVSAVFQTMFYGSIPLEEGPIKLPDITPDAFQNFLGYALADDTAGITMENVMDTLYCANKYMVDKLTRTCRNYVQLHISAESACTVLQQARNIGENELAELALAQISRLTVTAMESDSFLALPHDLLKEIVYRDTLNASEPVIYKNLYRWAEKQTDGIQSGSALREALGRIFNFIRFPLFPASQLADGPVADGVFQDNEVPDLFRYLLGNIKPDIPFITEERTPLTGAAVSFGVYATDFVTNYFLGNIVVEMRPDLAPECCQFLLDQINGKHRIVLVTESLKIKNYHADSDENLELRQSVIKEMSVMSSTIPGSVWFEWNADSDSKGGSVFDVQIATLAKYRSSDRSCVFGRITEGLDILTSFATFQRTADLILGKWYQCTTADWCYTTEEICNESSEPESDSD